MEFYEEILEKIDNGTNLTEEELSECVYAYEIDRTEGENRRWSRTIESIVELGDRNFNITWENGLTECQEDAFFEQPCEVEKYTYTKTITVTEWAKKMRG